MDLFQRSCEVAAHYKMALSETVVSPYQFPHSFSYFSSKGPSLKGPHPPTEALSPAVGRKILSCGGCWSLKTAQETAEVYHEILQLAKGGMMLLEKGRPQSIWPRLKRLYLKPVGFLGDPILDRSNWVFVKTSNLILNLPNPSIFVHIIWYVYIRCDLSSNSAFVVEMHGRQEKIGSASDTLQGNYFVSKSGGCSVW